MITKNLLISFFLIYIYFLSTLVHPQALMQHTRLELKQIGPIAHSGSTGLRFLIYI